MRPVVLLFFCLVAQLASAGEVLVLGKLQSAAMTEVSGIAVSGREPGVLWGINDSGNAPLLHAFARDGVPLGAVRVRGARNYDWEDMAAFQQDGEHFLLIADTGDNNGRRAISKLLVVAEPRRDSSGVYGGNINVRKVIRFSYEDGPRDCEAVAVTPAGEVLLVSKRQAPPVIYRLPLDLASRGGQVEIARQAGTITGLPRPTISEALESPLLGAWRHQPTAMDVDEKQVALVTYQNLYLFARQPGQSWAAALAGTPRVVHLPGLSQNEAVALDGDVAVVVAEGRRSPVIAVTH
ncbi:MAG: hypothetical protein KJO54_11080 [Gammaproteobacteria bacterium]|nr:hypothetical protein [Gammaproteobacteria bacterium]